jgi:trk system potassium uptake protein
VQLIGVRVKPDAPVAGKRLLEIGGSGDPCGRSWSPSRGRRDDHPDGCHARRGGGSGVHPGRAQQLPEVLPLAGYARFDLRRVIVAGGSREAWFLAHMLEEHRIDCTIIEADRRRAVELAEDLRRSLVFHGDATDLDLLEMEAIGEADGFVAYTGSDETNLLSCLLAKSLGARKVISLIERFDYIPLVARVGVDAAVSPRWQRSMRS